MGFLHYLKYCFCDIGCKIRTCKWKFILCVAVSLAGFVLGIVFFNLSNFGWWYYNRCTYASKLMSAGFSVLFSYALTTAIVYVSYVLCNMTRPTHYFCFLINLTACLYCGATVAAVFVYSAIWGVMYVIFVTVCWLATMCLASFLCLCEPPICRSFCESARDLKQMLTVIAVGFVCKVVALFIILKILTALI